MILGRLTPEALAPVPPEVLAALGLEPGDEVAWQVVGDRVTLMRVTSDDDDALDMVNYFAWFDEWATEADCEAYDKL